MGISSMVYMMQRVETLSLFPYRDDFKKSDSVINEWIKKKLKKLSKFRVINILQYTDGYVKILYEYEVINGLDKEEM